MANELQCLKVAILATDDFEQGEPLEPRKTSAPAARREIQSDIPTRRTGCRRLHGTHGSRLRVDSHGWTKSENWQICIVATSRARSSTGFTNISIWPRFLEAQGQKLYS